MDEPLRITLLVIRELERLGVRYLIGGSLASSIHGVVRASHDADVLAELRAEHAGQLAAALGGAFYIDEESVREAVAHGGCFNAIHLDTMFQIDVFASRGRAFDEEQLGRAIAIEIHPGRHIRVATAEDTVLAKLEWFRLGGEVSDLQWRDVLGVLKVQGDRLDMGYVRAWAEALGLTDLLTRALEDAGR